MKGVSERVYLQIGEIVAFIVEVFIEIFEADVQFEACLLDQGHVGSNSVEGLMVVIIYESTYFIPSQWWVENAWMGLTKGRIFVFVLKGKVGFDSLLAMKLRGKTGGWRKTVRERETSLACFEVLYAKGRNVLRVVLKLTGPVVGVAVKGWHYELQSLCSCTSS